MSSIALPANIQANLARFMADAKALPTKDLAPLLKKHGLEHVAPATLSKAARAVGLPREARVALLGAQQQSLASMAKATKEISKTALQTGKTFEAAKVGQATGWFAQTFPRASAAANSAVARLGTASGAAGKAITDAAAKPGVLGFLAKAAGKIAAPLAKIGQVARMVPFLNLAFVAVDGAKLLANPSGANLAKFGLSVGAALPIPGASLLGGARAAASFIPSPA